MRIFHQVSDWINKDRNYKLGINQKHLFGIPCVAWKIDILTKIMKNHIFDVNYTNHNRYESPESHHEYCFSMGHSVLLPWIQTSFFFQKPEIIYG